MRNTKRFFLVIHLLFFSSSFCRSQSLSICAGNIGTISVPQSLSTATILPANYTLTTSGFYIVSPTITTIYTLITTTLGPTTITNFYTVTVNPQPICAPVLNQASCTNSLRCFDIGLSFIPGNTTPIYTINWSNGGFGGPNIPVGVTSFTQTSQCGGILPGTYSGSVLANGGCLTVFQFSIAPYLPAISFSLSPPNDSINLNCSQPTLNVITSNSNLSYTWYPQNLPQISTNSLTINSNYHGILIVDGSPPQSNCIFTKTIVVTANTSTPVTGYIPTSEVTNCNPIFLPPTLTLSVSSPTINFLQKVNSPQNTVFQTTLNNSFYELYSPGVYSITITDLSNNCSVTKHVTVTSSNGMPVYTVIATHNYTLDCNANTLILVDVPVVVTNPPGNPVYFQFLSPGSPSVIPNGTLPLIGSGSQTINMPGTWTLCVKDGATGCTSRSKFTVSKTFDVPEVTIQTSKEFISCFNNSLVLTANTSISNPLFKWYNSESGLTSISNSNSLQVFGNVSTLTQTLLSNYSVTITDPFNSCSAGAVLSILQNLFKPTPIINSSVNPPCVPPSIVLSNYSQSSIPPFFPKNQIVSTKHWLSLSTQSITTNLESFSTNSPGTYSLFVIDLNNGCEANVSINLDLCVSLPEHLNTSVNIFSIYPNPTNASFIISLNDYTSQDYTIEVLNLIGKTIQVHNFSNTANNLNFSVENLPTGIYFVRATSGEKVMTKKVVVN